ncbi:transcription repressor OFP13 [Oryza brachyantha]|uniref:transcription repressor OFP13 n=1 Tax=Oryza brachyantha TaxID=4533 RepID=UPI001AD9B8BF|nr:transcription repressor OFP13 [Oryza brachyantha]
MVIGRLALSSLFHNKARDASPSPPPAPATAPPWVWPSCKNPRTQSFHAAPPPPGTRTIASIFLDSAESSFTASSARQDCSDSLSTASEASAAGGDGADTVTADDAIVRGLRSSDRLLFDPSASATSSILEHKSAGAGGDAFIGGVAVAFESEDPYVDFRVSMEEMVVAHGVGDWSWLEEMLGWYLRANGKDTHAAILAAFVDVIVGIADPALASCSSHRSSSCTITEESSLDIAETAKLTV